MLTGYHIICFGPSDWWTMNPSCATHIARNFAAENKVLYINPPSSDLLGIRSRAGLLKRFLRKSKSTLKFIRKPSRNLYVLSPAFIPIQGIAILDSINNAILKIQLRIIMFLLWFKSPLLWVENVRCADIIPAFRWKLVVYHVSDLFENCMYTRNTAKLNERQNYVSKNSDVLICVSQSLYNLKRAENANVHYLPHGVNFELFRSAAENAQTPPELENIPKPIAGYFGTMTQNNDIELLLYCARKLPCVSFVFAGQITGGHYCALRKLPNVYFLGQLPYSRIPAICANFDVCLLQWKMSNWIKHCNPLKTFEYMASGKPIVSVPIDEIADNYSDIISVAKTKEQFRRAILWELRNDTNTRKQKRIELARQNSWQNHSARLGRILTDTIQKRQTREAEMKKNIRICLVASAGGHMTQLLKLKDSWRGHEIFSVTTSAVIKEKLTEFGKVYIVDQCNRRQPLLIIKLILDSIKILLRQKPNIVISTGAAAGCVICLLAKIAGAKVIWIDSITNVESLSLSGKIVRYIADLFLVQWPQLAEKYRNVEYQGAVI